MLELDYKESWAQKNWYFYFFLFIFFKTDNKGLLYSTGNYIQYLVITYNERESEKLCIYLNHFAVDIKLKIL